MDEIRAWKKSWQRSAPKALAFLERDLEELLAFFDCPRAQHYAMAKPGCGRLATEGLGTFGREQLSVVTKIDGDTCRKIWNREASGTAVTTVES